jgi:nucleoside-diphosphate-sugar epimerase
MRVLVTGCAGFLGSHLSEHLVREGHRVTGVDALTDSYDPQWKLRNLDRLRTSDRFHFVHSELLKIEPHLVEDAQVIFHLAARPGVRTSWGAEFEHYLHHNVLSTQRMLEWAARSRSPKRIVFSSSSSVYGDTEVEQIGENHPANPVSPYGVTKLTGEQLCSLYAKQSGLEVITLRLFTVYGPRQRPDMAFHRLIHAALTGTKFVLYGDGRQRRDFTFVQDAVEALALAAHAPAHTDTFNVAGGARVTMNQAIHLVEEIAGCSIQVDREPPQSGDVRNTGADLSKSRDILGYSPRTSLRDGLRAQIESMQTQKARVASWGD